MLLVKPEVFIVDREKELNLLRNWVSQGVNVLVLGLRGYGKSTILRYLVEESTCDMMGVYIDCLLVFTPLDLVKALEENVRKLEEKGCVEFDDALFDRVHVRLRDARDGILAFYELVNELGVKFVVFDEVSSLLRKLGVQKPFKGVGGSRAVAELFKSLLDNFKNISTVFSDTSIEFLYELFKDYSAPLFREYQAVLEVDPLPFDAAYELVRKNASMRNLELDEDLISYIVELSVGVPIYVEMLLASLGKITSIDDAEEILKNEIENGIIDKYFTSLLDKFSWTEQEVLFSIAKGFKRFHEIERNVSGAAQALDSLEKKGMVLKIKKNRRESYYLLKDKLFSLWLAMKEKPGMKKLEYKKARILTTGFEALVREIFFTLSEAVTLKDALNNEITIKPPLRVHRYEGSLGEIDLIAEYPNNEAIIGEIYFGKNCKTSKINQLIKNIKTAEKMGYKVKAGLLITYYPPPKNILKYLQEQTKKEKLYLLTEKQLRTISKHSKTRLP